MQPAPDPQASVPPSHQRLIFASSTSSRLVKMAHKLEGKHTISKTPASLPFSNVLTSLCSSWTTVFSILLQHLEGVILHLVLRLRGGLQIFVKDHPGG